MVCFGAASLVPAQAAKDGWDGSVEFGALANFSETDSSAISAQSKVTFRGVRWEHDLAAKYYRSSSESLVAERDANDELKLDANGDEIFKTVTDVTDDRRFASLESRWFFTTRTFVFGVADVDVNKPDDLKLSSRTIAGLGYKFYENKKNFLSIGLGLGKKRLIEESGDDERDNIAYFTASFKRELSEKLLLSIDWDSDFSVDNRFSEAQFSLTWKLRDPLSLSFKYNLQIDSTPLDPFNTYDDGYEGQLSVTLVVNVF